MKYYGSPLCPDCVEATRIIKEKQLPHEYIEITASMLSLKEFLALRDHRPEFAEVREAGRIGIPCFLLEDDTITFDVERVIQNV